jgi:hypothetical protein
MDRFTFRCSVAAEESVGALKRILLGGNLRGKRDASGSARDSRHLIKVQVRLP